MTGQVTCGSRTRLLGGGAGIQLIPVALPFDLVSIDLAPSLNGARPTVEVVGYTDQPQAPPLMVTDSSYRHQRQLSDLLSQLELPEPIPG